MKTLNITLTEEEHEELSKLKEKLGLSWHDFILTVPHKEVQDEN